MTWLFTGIRMVAGMVRNGFLINPAAVILIAVALAGCAVVGTIGKPKLLSSEASKPECVSVVVMGAAATPTTDLLPPEVTVEPLPSPMNSKQNFDKFLKDQGL